MEDIWDDLFLKSEPSESVRWSLMFGFSFHDVCVSPRADVYTDDVTPWRVVCVRAQSTVDRCFLHIWFLQRGFSPLSSLRSAASVQQTMPFLSPLRFSPQPHPVSCHEHFQNKTAWLSSSVFLFGLSVWSFFPLCETLTSVNVLLAIERVRKEGINPPPPYPPLLQ